ncbi:MAG TPA: cell division ATP-binding protein FtsE, partial [Clostridiales bacterium]|nr:cell division ATP-binding protein FtsE [Clostridiales bacterium]
VIVCTHDSNLVDRMKKRVIEIEDGVVVRDKKGSRYNEPEKKPDPEFEGYG